MVIRNTEDKMRAKSRIDSLPGGEVWEVAISRQKRNRSISQNSLYWLYMACIAEETGSDKETIHQWCKSKFLGQIEITIAGESYVVARETKSLNTRQFSQYTDRIVQWAATELGIILPDPQEAYFEAFKKAYEDFV